MEAQKPASSESDVFCLKRRSRVEGEPVTELSSDMEEEDVINDIVPAASASLQEAAKKAMSVVLKVMMSVCTFYDVIYRYYSETHKDVVG